MFVVCFPTERQDAFLLGQRQAFEFWGGVPRTACFDNLKPAVLKILQGRRRVEQEAFRHFRSVYGFEAVFTNVAAGWELAQKELRLPKLLAQYRKVDLILVDELGYLPFAQSSAEVLFQFFRDRYEVASVGITSNLEFGRWTEVFGNERLTAALLDRLVHRSHAFLLEGASYRFRQSLQQREGATNQ